MFFFFLFFFWQRYRISLLLSLLSSLTRIIATHSISLSGFVSYYFFFFFSFYIHHKHLSEILPPQTSIPGCVYAIHQDDTIAYIIGGDDIRRKSAQLYIYDGDSLLSTPLFLSNDQMCDVK